MSAQTILQFDICRRKHGGNRQSERANERSEPHKASLRVRLLAFIMACDDRGSTSAEIERLFGIPKNKFSGRLAELKADELIFDSGREREGCSVLVARVAWCNGSDSGR